MSTSPLLIGLVGGIASGKSAVAAEFARLGARVIDADAVAHDLLDDPEVRRDLAAAFGDVVTEGRIDRKKLSAAAFAGPKTVRRLNSILHPRVTSEIERVVEGWTHEGFGGIVVIDAALLLEAGMKPLLGEVVFVEAPEELRRQRAAARGWSEQEIVRRERLQMPLDEKKRLSDATVGNGGLREEMATQVKALVSKWQGAPR